MEEKKQKNIDNNLNDNSGRSIADVIGISAEELSENQIKALARISKAFPIADDLVDRFNEDDGITINVMMLAFAIFIKRLEDSLDMDEYEKAKKNPTDTPFLELLRTIIRYHDGYKYLCHLRDKHGERFWGSNEE